MKYFSPSLLIAILGAPYLVLAQSCDGPNCFTMDQGFSATAGSPVTLTWKVTTGSTVTLVLRSGASNNLDAGATIACMFPPLRSADTLAARCAPVARRARLTRADHIPPRGPIS